MANILLRDLPDEVVAAIDARAARVGLSRTEYIRRALERERAGSAGPVTIDDLARVAVLAADLADPHVMFDAWS
ncbi:MAG: CopG family transcriptional regulator [Ilumatobacteraceae bacterium]